MASMCASPFAGFSPIASSSYLNKDGASVLDQRLATIMSQQSIDGMLVYTNTKAETIDTNELRQPVVPAVRPSLSCEVVSHMFNDDDQRGLGDPSFELDEITAGSSRIISREYQVESPSRHLKCPPMITSFASPTDSPSVHLTDIVPQSVSNTGRRRKKAVRRPIPKRVLRVQEARKTMTPGEFEKWRAYREKNNRSVKLSRQRKRDAKKEAERLRLKNLALTEKIASLKSTTNTYMGMLVNNAI